MKLVIYDGKHERVNDELELGKLTAENEKFIQKIIGFLDKNGMTDRYKQLLVIENYKQWYDEEYGYNRVEFE